MLSDRIEMFFDIFLYSDNPLVQVFGRLLIVPIGGFIWACALVWEGIRKRLEAKMANARFYKCAFCPTKIKAEDAHGVVPISRETCPKKNCHDNPCPCWIVVCDSCMKKGVLEGGKYRKLG